MYNTMCTGSMWGVHRYTDRVYRAMWDAHGVDWAMWGCTGLCTQGYENRAMWDVQGIVRCTVLYV